METDVPSARCWHRTEVTGKALTTFKLSSALSPTSHLFFSTSLLHLSLTPPWTPRPSKEKLPTWFFLHSWNPACATSPVWAGRCLLCWHPWQGSPRLGSTPRSHSAPGSEPTAPLCGSPHSTCTTSQMLGCFFRLVGFFPHRKKRELKHQNTELRLQIEAATATAINAPFVSTQVPAVQCFYIFLTAISVKHQK